MSKAIPAFVKIPLAKDERLKERFLYLSEKTGIENPVDLFRNALTEKYNSAVGSAFPNGRKK